MKKIFLLSLAALTMAIVAPISASASTYNGTSVSPGADGKTYTINAGAGDTLTLTDVGSSKGQMPITFKNNVSGSVVIVESSSRPSSATSDPSGSVNTYFDVTLNGFSNTDVSSAKWRFNVSKDWLRQRDVSSGNVFLHHYSSSWERLTTREVSSTATSHNFEADVTSFSPFAVVAVPGLSNTGNPYMLGALIALGILTVITVSFVLSRKKHA